jgi:multimeric flavodoxin WrbA
MTGKKTVLGLVGSPNREGRTNELVRAALEGARREGATTELIQMAGHVVAACKDCLPWICMNQQKCTYEDEAFDFLSRKILDCGALVLGTPVYWWDTSGLVKYLILKMFRVFARSAPLQGLPALGLAIAGGTGNGLISGLRPVYHFFQVMQMRALDPVPATRFNFSEALQQAETLGRKIAELADRRRPFSGLEERLLWYDALPYLGMSRAGERRLLADLAALALPAGADSSLAQGLLQADALAASGQTLESMKEITRVYDTAVKAFEKK